MIMLIILKSKQVICIQRTKQLTSFFEKLIIRTKSEFTTTLLSNSKDSKYKQNLGGQ